MAGNGFCARSGKQKHATAEDARAAMASLRSRMGGRQKRNTKPGWPMQVYRCPWCGDWHFGHTPKRKLKKEPDDGKTKKAERGRG